MVLNDRWHDILNNPTLWVESLRDLITEGGTGAFQTQVMPAGHADFPRLYFTQGNLIHEFDGSARQMRPEGPTLLEEAGERPYVLALLRDHVRMAREMLDRFEDRLNEISPS